MIHAEWWHPENLEHNAREIEGQRLQDANPYGDFGSYKIVNVTNRITSDSMIEEHNLVNKKTLVPFSQLIIDLYRSKRRSNFDALVDLGCGLGYLTSAFQQVTGVERHGIEISKDAIEYATRNHPACSFICGAINPYIPTDEYLVLSRRLGEKPFLVIASEFYPFTRTSDAHLHRTFLDHIFSIGHVTGLILINNARYLWRIVQEKTFLSSLSSWQSWGFHVESMLIPHPWHCLRIPPPLRLTVSRILSSSFPLLRGTSYLTFVTRS